MWFRYRGQVWDGIKGPLYPGGDILFGANAGRVGCFRNPESALRLASAVFMEISEDRETGRVYLSMDAARPGGNHVGDSFPSHGSIYLTRDERCVTLAQ